MYVCIYIYIMILHTYIYIYNIYIYNIKYTHDFISKLHDLLYNTLLHTPIPVYT
jgi:hypothetical protein